MGLKGAVHPLLTRTRPDPADLSRCVHCGLCLPNCPTYLDTADENESPRGRLHLIQAVSEGRLEPTPAMQRHVDLCLVCRNCETVCPSGVPFGRIMEAARAQIEEAAPGSPVRRLLRRLVFRELLPHQERLRALFGLLRLYQRSGLQWLFRRLPGIPPRLREAERLLPRLSAPFQPRFDVYHAQGERRFRVGLFTGCVMPLIYGPVHEATIRVLTWNGCEVHVPRQQSCCGALNVHAGERTVAAKLARQNVRAFLGRGLDAVVVNSAGCGSAMKEYEELLGPSPEVVELVRVIKDVSEFMAEIGIRPPAGRVNALATVQESCHLAHAQGIRTAPRDLLGMVPGLIVQDMEHPDLCCGSAGLYSLTESEMSMRLLDAKMADVSQTGARLVVTMNPGCMLQLQAGLQRAGLEGEVRHVVEILDRAYATAPGDQHL